MFHKPACGRGRMINDGRIFVYVWTILLTETKRKSVENCVWLPWLISVVPFEPLRSPYSFSVCLTLWLSQEWLISSGGIFFAFQSPPTSRWRPLPAAHWTTARWWTRAARTASGWTPSAVGHAAARHVSELWRHRRGASSSSPHTDAVRRSLAVFSPDTDWL